MRQIDEIYLSILTQGLIALREAAYKGDAERCFREAEHLHNIPSLIGEENLERHFYYFNVERNSYCEWAKNANRAELIEFIQFQCVPLWEKLLKELSVNP